MISIDPLFDPTNRISFNEPKIDAIPKFGSTLYTIWNKSDEFVYVGIGGIRIVGAIGLVIALTTAGCSRNSEDERSLYRNSANNAVKEVLSVYKEDGIVEVSGLVFECYETAMTKVDQIHLASDLRYCMMMDRVGYQIDNAVASHLKVEPTHYFSESPYISRLQENGAKIGLTNEQANSLMEAVDLSLSNEEKIGK
jgi:hypothetical protein